MSSIASPQQIMVMIGNASLSWFAGAVLYAGITTWLHHSPTTKNNRWNLILRLIFWIISLVIMVGVMLALSILPVPWKYKQPLPPPYP